MSYNEKLFYSICIKNNAYRFSTFGREANKTLNDLLVLSIENIPKWVGNIRIPKIPEKNHIMLKKLI